ncbi:MAG: SDR family oxidoreductase [Planctomycetota bacterium]
MSTRVLLVTGGAVRVGRAILLHFARLGYDVAFTYRSSADQASSLTAEIEKLERQCLAIQVDFEADDAVSRIADALADRFDRLDVLVHNASVYHANDLAAVTPEVFRRDLRVHAEVPLFLTKRLAPLLTASRGSVVAMTDVDLARSRPSHLSYLASKATLSSLMANLARELAPEVTVNCIAPGAVAWPDDMPEADKERYLSRVPAGRVGTPEDVAHAVEFLTSRGRYLTGETLRLDGGRHLR